MAAQDQTIKKLEGELKRLEGRIERLVAFDEEVARPFSLTGKRDPDPNKVRTALSAAKRRK